MCALVCVCMGVCFGQSECMRVCVHMVACMCACVHVCVHWNAMLVMAETSQSPIAPYAWHSSV